MPKESKELKFVKRVPYYEHELLKPNLSMILYQEAVEAEKGTGVLKSRKDCKKCGNWEPTQDRVPGYCKFYDYECLSSLRRPKFIKKELKIEQRKN